MTPHPQIRDYSPEDAAAWLCSLGMSVFPLESRGKRPPAGFSWQACQTERLPAARVCELAERYPGCNWAVALG
ncbi:MAG: bifunctional DNA primase/polymerase, partial [Desulfovibrio sp.]|nr:bifunctional DNA primase/polymerase [Desulfovibrio sp.]